jgi:hypothetical protein
MDNLINQLIHLYQFSPEDVLALKAILGAFLIGLMGAMLWNIYRPAPGWRAEWRRVNQANRERRESQAMEKRLAQVGR